MSVWGSPDAVTFEKKHVRLVAVDDLRVRVHRFLQPIVAKCLRDLAVLNYEVEELDGWPVLSTGRAILLRVKGLSDDATATALAGYGFKPLGADVYEWAGTADEAEAASAALHEESEKALESTAVAALPAQEPSDPHPSLPEVPKAHSLVQALPGSRDLTIGDSGTDVLFIQAYFETPRTGTYGEEDAGAVAYFQQMRYREVTGDATVDTWQLLIPRTKDRMRVGDAGRIVRLLSSAMIAAGHAPEDSVVFDRFTAGLASLVRELQPTVGAEPNGVVGYVEWSALLGNPWAENPTIP